jgi:FMN-dependent NADH-azoreductase
MRRIRADVWQLDLKVVEADFTLVGVNPALEHFKELAQQLRHDAEEQARPRPQPPRTEPHLSAA